MTDEQFFTEMSIQIVLDRLFNLAVSRTLEHRETADEQESHAEEEEGERC